MNGILFLFAFLGLMLIVVAIIAYYEGAETIDYLTDGTHHNDSKGREL